MSDSSVPEPSASASASASASETTVHSFAVKKANGEEQKLADFQGKVLLIVNTASQCGFTPQYAGLEALQKELGAEKFQVLAFPCNQFGGQEPGDDDEIALFCKTKYDVSFPGTISVSTFGGFRVPN